MQHRTTLVTFFFIYIYIVKVRWLRGFIKDKHVTKQRKRKQFGKVGGYNYKDVHGGEN
jgi:hypothetical protein